MRAEELVGRAEQEVAADGPDVDRPVQRVVHGVYDAERAGVACERDGSRDVVHGAHGVRRVADGDHLGLAGLHELLERAPVEAARLEVDGRLTDDRAALGQPLPGSAVGLVIELGDQHLVAGADVAGDRIAEQEAERGHVGAEADLLPVAAEEVGAGFVRSLDDGVGLFRGHERAVDVAVVIRQVVDDGVEHTLRRLCAARAVEVGGWLAVDHPPEGGELAADVRDVKRGHGSPRAGSWQGDQCTVPVQERRAWGRMV